MDDDVLNQYITDWSMQRNQNLFSFRIIYWLIDTYDTFLNFKFELLHNYFPFLYNLHFIRFLIINFFNPFFKVIDFLNYTYINEKC